MTFSVPVREGPLPAWADRALAFAVLATGLAVVWLLWLIDPDPRGHGTHVRLGMAPCGWAQSWEVPCPTCGVTTAACWLVHLAPHRALAANPFGAALAAAGLWAAGFAAACLLRGRAFLEPCTRLPFARLLAGALALLLLSWGYKYLTFVP